MNVMLKYALVNINIWLILSMSIYFSAKGYYISLGLLEIFVQCLCEVLPWLAISFCVLYTLCFTLCRNHIDKDTMNHILVYFLCGITLFFSNGRFWLRTWHTDDDPSEGRNASGGLVSVLLFCWFWFWDLGSS